MPPRTPEPPRGSASAAASLLGASRGSVRGLTLDQEAQATAAFFAAFPWQPPPVDPGQLSASSFFAGL